MSERIPFNKPFIGGNELYYISQCVRQGQISGDGPYSKRCERIIRELIDAQRVLLTTSCASALHIAALLCNIEPGDEVIMPSYCEAEAANAFLSVGAKLVFVDIEVDTLNIDMAHVEGSLTDRTRVILSRHHFGTACNMNRLLELSEDRRIRVVEDVTEGFGARYHGKALGTFGDFGAFSFHETQGLTGSEGGALVINDPTQYERAEIIREKGTNRSQLFRGQVDKYTWMDLGSSCVLSDLLAAFHAARLENVHKIETRKRALFKLYTEVFSPLAEHGLIRLQAIPTDCQTNHPGFFFLVKSEQVRQALLAHLSSRGIAAAFHLSPLHESVMGRKLGYEAGMLPTTEGISRRIVRLPFYYKIRADQVLRIAQTIYEFFSVNGDLTKLHPPVSRVFHGTTA
jgi:dTDP-4-amino-4,6-dideoxygalactose transaminase